MFYIADALIPHLLSSVHLFTDNTFVCTVNSLISGHHHCKKFCPLIGGVRLLESFFSYGLKWVPD